MPPSIQVSQRVTIWCRERMGRQALEVGELSKTVAKLLESARDEQGVSYRELQQRSGINRMRAQRILTEERPFTVDEVDEIAQAFGRCPGEPARALPGRFSYRHPRIRDPR